MRLTWVCVAMVMLAGGARAGDLNILGWEGYADDSFVKPFTARTGCNVTATYVGSNDEIVAKVLGGNGSSVDLVTPSNDTTTELIEADAVEPVDITRLPHLAEYYPAFRSPKWLMKDGRQYGVPFAFGVTRIVLKRGVLADVPNSLSVLWDPRLKGKLTLWADVETLYMAARYLGIANVYTMTDDQLARVRDALIRQKPNIVKYWTTDAEFLDLYTSGAVVGGNTNEINLAKLRAAGDESLQEIVPKEGRSGWSDSWLIVKGAGDNPCVYQWLDWVSTAQAQALATKVTNYSFANPGAFALLDHATQERMRQFGLVDPAALDRISWWQAVPRREKYLEILNQVRAAGG